MAEYRSAIDSSINRGLVGRPSLSRGHSEPIDVTLYQFFASSRVASPLYSHCIQTRYSGLLGSQVFGIYTKRGSGRMRRPDMQHSRDLVNADEKLGGLPADCVYICRVSLSLSYRRFAVVEEVRKERQRESRGISAWQL